MIQFCHASLFYRIWGRQLLLNCLLLNIFLTKKTAIFVSLIEIFRKCQRLRTHHSWWKYCWYFLLFLTAFFISLTNSPSWILLNLQHSLIKCILTRHNHSTNSHSIQQTRFWIANLRQKSLLKVFQNQRRFRFILLLIQILGISSSLLCLLATATNRNKLQIIKISIVSANNRLYLCVCL